MCCKRSARLSDIVVKKPLSNLHSSVACSIVTSHFQMCINIYCMCMCVQQCIERFSVTWTHCHLCNSILNLHISYCTCLICTCMCHSIGKDVRCTYEAASLLFNPLSVFLPLQTPPLPTVFKGRLTWASLRHRTIIMQILIHPYGTITGILFHRSLTAYNGIRKSHMRGRLIPPSMWWSGWWRFLAVGLLRASLYVGAES